MKWSDYFRKTSLVPRPFPSSPGMRLIKTGCGISPLGWSFWNGGRRKEGGGSPSLLCFSSDKLGSLQKDATKDGLQCFGDQPLLPAVHTPPCVLERHRLRLRATLLPHRPLASLPLPGHCWDWVLLYTQVWVNKSERFFNSDYSKVMVLLYFALCHGQHKLHVLCN